MRPCGTNAQQRKQQQQQQQQQREPQLERTCCKG
jgi:hypothetical protein